MAGEPGAGFRPPSVADRLDHGAVWREHGDRAETWDRFAGVFENSPNLCAIRFVGGLVEALEAEAQLRAAADEAQTFQVLVDGGAEAVLLHRGHRRQLVHGSQSQRLAGATVADPRQRRQREQPDHQQRQEDLLTDSHRLTLLDVRSCESAALKFQTLTMPRR